MNYHHFTIEERCCLNKVKVGDEERAVSGFFASFFRLSTTPFRCGIRIEKYNFGRKVMRKQTTIRPP